LFNCDTSWRYASLATWETSGVGTGVGVGRGVGVAVGAGASVAVTVGAAVSAAIGSLLGARVPADEQPTRVTSTRPALAMMRFTGFSNLFRADDE
jgi:hypothetical protein